MIFFSRPSRFSFKRSNAGTIAIILASPSIRQRILDAPQLFLKAHQQVSSQPSKLEFLLRFGRPVRTICSRPRLVAA
jgi:hypothetical protein